MEFSEVEESGLTLEQELILRRIYGALRHCDRQQLLESALWAWEQLLLARNDFLNVLLDLNAVVEMSPLEIRLFPEDPALPLPQDELQQFKQIEGLLDDDDEEEPGVGVR